MYTSPAVYVDKLVNYSGYQFCPLLNVYNNSGVMGEVRKTSYHLDKMLLKLFI